MLDAAIQALAQMASPPFRALLTRSIALAIVLLIVLGIGIDRGLVALVERGGAWIEIHAGPGAHTPVNILEWMVAIAAREIPDVALGPLGEVFAVVIGIFRRAPHVEGLVHH